MKFYRWFIPMLLIVFVGCQNIFPKKTTTSQKPPKPKGAIVAKVGDWYLTLKDFNTMIDNINEVADFTKVRIETFEDKKAVLTNLINQELLAQYARDKGVDKRDDVKLNISNAQRNILAAEVEGEIVNQIDVSFSEVQEWYDKNKEYLREPEKRWIKEIVVSNEDTAKNLLSRLYQGEDFSTLARQFSEALSKDKGGDLGYVAITRETIQDQKFDMFWSTALNLEKGQVSTYFKSPEKKFYIIKVEDVTGGEQQTLVALQDQIKEMLREEKRQTKILDIINSTKSQIGVEINEELLR